MKDSILKTMAEIKEFMLNSTQISNRLPSKYSIGGKTFLRNRKLPMLTLVCLILLQVKKSLAINVDEFFTRWSDLFFGPKQDKAPTPEAVCKRRTTLSPEIFLDFTRASARIFFEEAQGALWNDYRVLSIDGSTISLPNTKQVASEFGRPHNNKGELSPFANVSLLFDPLNRLIVDGAIGPCDKAEVTTGMELIVEHASSSRLFLLDRLYASYRLACLCGHKGCKFVCRSKTALCKSVIDFMNSEATDSDIVMTANRKSVKGLESIGFKACVGDTLNVRAVKIELPSGETEILLTNLTREEASMNDLSYLYQMRWSIEENYEILKNEEQVEIFTGFRPVCIRQDFYAALFLYNIESLISKLDTDFLNKINQIKKERNAPPLQIDCNFTWHVLREYLCPWIVGDLNLEQQNAILMKISSSFLMDLIESNSGKHLERRKKAYKINGKFITFTNYKQAV